MGELTREDILRKWEEAHGVLPPQWRQQFLERDEVALMTMNHERSVDWCIRKSPKLVNILRCLDKNGGRRADTRSPSHDPYGSGAVNKWGTPIGDWRR